MANSYDEYVTISFLELIICSSFFFAGATHFAFKFTMNTFSIACSMSNSSIGYQITAPSSPATSHHSSSTTTQAQPHQ